MSPVTTQYLVLLRAFEKALREGLLLDEVLGGILDASLSYFDAASAVLLPAGGAPPISRSGSSLVAVAAEQRLVQKLTETLASGKDLKYSESGLAFRGLPVKVSDQVRAAFGVALGQGLGPDTEEALRLFTRAFSQVLDRDRQKTALVKRREEAVALFDLASGALHSLKADEVIRLTVTTLARELAFDRVVAHRYDPDTREVQEIFAHPGGVPDVPSAWTELVSDELLVRCLSAREAAFDDDPDTSASGQARRRRMALPVLFGDTVFGFLTMSRRGAFALTAQELRLAQELAKLAAGALEKARLIEAESAQISRVSFVNSLRAALGGLTDVPAVTRRTVQEVGAYLGFDVCAIRLLPSGELPGAASVWTREAGPIGGHEPDRVPDTLLLRLSASGGPVSLGGVSGDSPSFPLLPAEPSCRALPKPLALAAVPLMSRNAIIGVLAGVTSSRSRALDPMVVMTLEAIATELSLAVASAQLFSRERESYRFLDRLREVGRSLMTTFDGPRVKQTLCEQSVQLLGADTARFWDADPEKKSFEVSVSAGKCEGYSKTVALESHDHPIVRAFSEKTLALLPAREAVQLTSFGELEGGPVRAAVLPLVYNEEPIGVLTLEARRGPELWPGDFTGRLSLLADVGAAALHNARLLKIIERQTERDPQTGLYNRPSIIRRLEAEVRRAERSGTSITLAHVRLDGLMDAVQRWGAEMGEAILPKAAAQLLRSTRSLNVVGRDSFDRFWILVFDASREQGQLALAAIQRNFDGKLDPRLSAAGLRLHLTAGLSTYPTNAFDTQGLMYTATECLERAIAAGPGTVIVSESTSV